MYLPSCFREERAEVVEALLRDHSFGVLVSQGPSGLLATHLPMLREHSRGGLGVLVGHMARGNPQWQEVSKGAEVLAIFAGPNAYVSPRWYSVDPDVPTWNYGAAHVYGHWNPIVEPTAVRALLERTIARYEARFTDPWLLGTLNEDLVQGLERGIVAFEIEITRVLCAMKMSQDKNGNDVRGVVAGLEQSRDGDSIATARLMRRLHALGDG